MSRSSKRLEAPERTFQPPAKALWQYRAGVLCLLVLLAIAFPLRAGSAPGNSQQGGLPALERRVAVLEELAAPCRA